MKFRTALWVFASFVSMVLFYLYLDKSIIFALKTLLPKKAILFSKQISILAIPKIHLVLSVTGFLFFLLFKRKLPHLLFFFRYAALSGFIMLFGGILKLLTARARPILLLQDNVYGFFLSNDILGAFLAGIKTFFVSDLFDNFRSFPSSHTSLAFGLAALYSREKKTHTLIAYMIASLISLARIFGLKHYPSDLIAGALLGIWAASLVGWVLEKWEKKLSGNIGSRST